jgi:RimJ/RimL family protein N-acetyltransferase
MGGAAVTGIETPRLRLRSFALSDLDALAAILADPEVMRYMPGGRPIPREQVARNLPARIERLARDGFGMWAVERTADGRLIGQCGLFHLDNTPEIEVAYLLDRACWGQGLASEAAGAALRYGFETLGLPRIVGVALPANRASCRVLEKIGLRFERPARYYDLDVAYYGLDRADWRPT